MSRYLSFDRVAIILGALSVAVVAPPAQATINKMEFISDYTPGQTVRVYRGKEAKIKLRGPSLDLSTGIEIVDPTATGANKDKVAIPSAITDRNGGSNSNIEIKFTPMTIHRLGEYEVRIRYAVETNGPDKFKIRVLDVGTVDTIEMINAPQYPNSRTTYNYRAKGKSLEQATLCAPALERIGSPTYEAGARTATTFEFKLNFSKPGVINLSRLDFVDKNLPSDIPVPPEAQFGGNGAIVKAFQVNPTLETTSEPSQPADSHQVTVEGSGLKPAGFDVELQYMKRYMITNESISFPVVVPANDLTFTVADDKITFTANKNMRPGTLKVVYKARTDAFPNMTHLFQQKSFPLAPNMHIEASGEVTVVGASGPATFLPGSSVPMGVLTELIGPGENQLRGKYLSPPPGKSTGVKVDGKFAAVKKVQTSDLGADDVLTFEMTDFPNAKRAELAVITLMTDQILSVQLIATKQQTIPQTIALKGTTLIAKTATAPLSSPVKTVSPTKQPVSKSATASNVPTTLSTESDEPPQVTKTVNLIPKPVFSKLDGSRKDAAGNLALKAGDMLLVEGRNLAFIRQELSGTWLISKPQVRIGDQVLPYNLNDGVTDYGNVTDQNDPAATRINIKVKPGHAGKKISIKTVGDWVDAGIFPALVP